MLDDAASSGLDERDARTLKFRALTPAENKKLTNEKFGNAPGYVMPYEDIHGKPVKGLRCKQIFRRRNLEKPKGPRGGDLDVKPGKWRYCGPPGELPHLYFPQNFKGWVPASKDVTEPIYGTEGEKKAACLCKHGVPAFSVPGVWGWKSSKHGIDLLEDFKQIDWGDQDNHRPVYLVFDNDVTIKPAVMGALNALARELTKLCAEVFIKPLPPGPLKGVDDFIVAKGIDAFHDLPVEEFATSKELWAFQERVAYIRKGNFFVDVEDLRTFPDVNKLKQAFGNLSYMAPTADGEGEKLVYVVDEWVKFKHRRTHPKLTYAPGKEIVVGDALNTWRGWGVEPTPGDVKPFLDLVEFILADEPDHIVAWFYQWLAYPLQYPGTKLTQGVLVWGRAQGVGKSFIGDIMRSIYGDNASRVEKEDLVGDWNGWLINKQFVHGEEITGGDSRQVQDKSKNMITRKTVRHKEKYQAAYEVESCENYYLTSNHEDSLHLAPEDRRFLVIHAKRPKKSDAFYQCIDKWLREGGAAHLFHYLLNEVDCSEFNPNAKAPVTAAKEQMQDHSKSDLDLFATEVLENPDEVLKVGRVVLKHDLFTGKAIQSLAATRCDRHVTLIAVSKALSRAGIEGRKVFVDGNSVKLWPLRRPNVWVGRTSGEWAEHHKEASKGPKYE